MPQGYSFAGTCYTLEPDAQDAYYASNSPTVISGSPTYIFKYEKNENVWQFTKKSVDDFGVITDLFATDATNTIFPSCELNNDPTANFMLGSELGWQVTTAMVIAFCIARLKRGF